MQRIVKKATSVASTKSAPLLPATDVNVRSNKKMSFNNDAKLVKDTLAPIGARYMSLRHCVGQYSPFGFNRTWEILEKKFGLKEGEINTSEALISAIEFLEQDRTEWLIFNEAKTNFIKSRVKRGLTKPKIIIDHGK